MKNFGISRTLQMIGVLSLVACGGAEDGGSADPAAGGSAGSGMTGGSSGSGGSSASGGSGGSGGASVCDARVAESVSVNQSFWHSGFQLSLGTAAVTMPTDACSTGEVVIDLEQLNRGASESSFRPRVLLTSNGVDYEPNWSASDMPEVLGERTLSGTLVIPIDREFVLDQATLLVGSATEHQAVIPIGDASPDSLVTLEPQVPPMPAGVDAGHLRFAFKRGWLRADDPNDFSTLDPDTLQLVYWLDITAFEDVGTVADYLNSESFVLTLPNGAVLAPAKAPSESFSALGETLTDEGLFFSIPEPVAGTYTLTISGDWGPSGEVLSASTTFTLEAPTVFGE